MKTFFSGITGKTYGRMCDLLFDEQQARGMTPAEARKGLFVDHPGTGQFAQGVVERQQKLGVYGEKPYVLGEGMSEVEKTIVANMRRR